MNINKLPLIAGLGACGALLPSGALAQPVLLEDFQSYEVGVAADSTFEFVSREDGVDPIFEIIEFPQGSGNKALWVNANSSGVLWGDMWVQFQIPVAEQIPPEGTGSVWFRAMMGGYSGSWHLSVADMYPVTSSGWGDHAAIVRVGENSDGQVTARDGGAYVPAEPVYNVALGEWYEFRMDIDNGNETYEVFVKGPSDTEFQQLTFGSSTSVGFRQDNYSGQAIQTIAIGTNSGSPLQPHQNNPWLVDDIMVEAGEGGGNEDPVWCDFVAADGGTAETGAWINTGAWLGWLYYKESNGSWVYSYDLGWIYTPNCPGEAGAWAYVPRF
jgi:hypothetical protein